MEPAIINDKKYYWTQKPSKKEIRDCLKMWQDFAFRYDNRDYAIERRKDGFVIRDLQIDGEGCVYDKEIYIYPESGKAQTPEEFLSMPFLGGKTIFERYNELQFFCTFRPITYFDENNVDTMLEIIETGNPVFFNFRNQLYMIEAFADLGYIIVEPKRYCAEGSDPENTKAAYPLHLQAKTYKDFVNLPFLEGKTFTERFGELRFFDL